MTNFFFNSCRFYCAAALYQGTAVWRLHPLKERWVFIFIHQFLKQWMSTGGVSGPSFLYILKSQLTFIPQKYKQCLIYYFFLLFNCTSCKINVQHFFLNLLNIIILKCAFDQILSNKFCMVYTRSDFALQYYVDGGFSSMLPLLPVPSNQILTVSPFSGEMDICPADTPSMWNMVVSGSTLKGNMANSIRIFNALYPTTVEVQHNINNTVLTISW